MEMGLGMKRETRTRKKEKRKTTRIKRTIENREWIVKNVTEKTENKSHWGQRKSIRSQWVGERENYKNKQKVKNL